MLLVFVCSLLALRTAAPSDATLVLKPSEVWFLMAESETPPADAVPHWQRRALPDNWNESQPGVGGNGWYRIPLYLDQPPDHLWAIHLPRLSLNAAVFVNGVFIGDGGRFTEPMSRNWNRPLYFLLPAGVLHQGDNTLHIRLFAYPNDGGGLYALQVGPDDALQAEYRWRLFLKIDLNQISTVITALIGLFLGTLWVRRRQDSTYGWLAGTMLLWAANNTHYFVRDLPISTWWWEWFAQVGTDGFAVFLAISTLRFLGLRRPRIERVMFGYLVIGGLVVAIADWDRGLAVASLLHIGALAIGVYMVSILLWHSWPLRPFDDSAVLTVGVLIQCSLGLHDWWLQLGGWQQDHWYLMHYASPLLFAVLTWILTSRFVKALNTSEALNYTLEQRVQEKHKALEESYRTLRAFEQQQAVAEERERIMQDLHDGLGGHLVTALALLEQSGQEAAVEQTLRDALYDLRLVIDSLDPDNGDLPVLLGMIRTRIESRLSPRGLHFQWQVKNVPPLPGFGPATALHILRIVQEALTNILKHARAHTITVRTGASFSTDGHPVGVYLEVCDDGQGIQNCVQGRGLNNMRRRAQSIGGKLDVTSDTSGTCVRLWLPLDQAADTVATSSTSFEPTRGQGATLQSSE